MLGLVLVAEGQAYEAAEHALQALRLFHEAGDVGGITMILDDLASIAVSDGDGPRAGRLSGRRGTSRR